ncbi:MAG: glutamine synthetase family protein [Rhodococcus sp. (in: high G+C Gram-positive bacteria)]|uniref:glutamine synthetase family protein n=1 Tax=Rhodococcus sp. TaxID=1831 RepID=UPI003BB13607
MSTPAKFVARHSLFDAAQQEAADRARSVIEENNIEMVRLAWPDQHGLIRGKTMTAENYLSALAAGTEITMAPFFFDTANAIVFNPFSPGGGFGIPQLSGSPNMTMVPDPTTFKVLPWAQDTGWVLCDLYFRDGSAFPFSPRNILRNALAQLESAGYHLVTGLEVELYLTRVLDDNLVAGSLGAPGSPADPPVVAPVARGYNYLLESHLDEIDDALRPIRKTLSALGLPLRSIDDEWAPSQVEMTFDVIQGMAAADSMLLFRSAVKQVCRRNGYLASFMSTPGIEGFYASGWHLHTSLVDTVTGENVMVPGEGELLSDIGRHYIGGTLAHAAAASPFMTPTINGYRRRRPYSLAPDRLTWGLDNRAAMMRVISAPGDKSSHVENRVGEPAANPYLYIAAQAAAGLDGIKNKTEPGAPSEDPYAADVPHLPATLKDGLVALGESSFFRDTFGDQFVDYFVTMKTSEVSRYEAHLAQQPDPEGYAETVTEWEHREYFELF